MPDIIGLAGFAQSGKDSTAGYMRGYERLAFADSLKDTLYDLNPVCHVVERGEGRDPGLYTVQQLVGAVGWETAKTKGTVRLLLQRLGVAVRDHVDSDAWVNAVFSKVRPGRQYVISDVRFPNEFAAVTERGGQVWRIERPGCVAPNDHISEHALNGYSFDQVIENNGSLDDLEVQVGEVLDEYVSR